MPAILLRHILPNLFAPLMVQATFIAASAILTEAVLSFLGVGIPPHTPSWGNIMAEGRNFVAVAFHIILYPGLFLGVTVLAVNPVGDGLRDMLDPRRPRNSRSAHANRTRVARARPDHLFRWRRDHHGGRQRPVVRSAARRDAGPGRRIRLRQERHLAVHHATAARARSRAGGAIEFAGQDLLALPEKAMRAIRGNQLSMIFQEPMTSLNPVFTIGRQIAESLTLHQGLSRREALAQAERLLDPVQISDPARRVHEYPYQLSGGMRQRAMIAMALACQPKVLIADEPTTALDVTIQAQILHLLRDIQARLGTAIVLITHDLGVVAQMCQRVIVMYAGRKVEEGSVDDVLDRPQHPYTQALIRSLPAFADGQGHDVRLAELPGIVPVITPESRGCFAARCPQAMPRCTEEIRRPSTPPSVTAAGAGLKRKPTPKRCALPLRAPPRTGEALARPREVAPVPASGMARSVKEH